MAKRKNLKRPKRPAAGAVSDAREPRSTLQFSWWTVDRIELAKRRADSGDLSLAADLWERVMGDERAFGPIQAIVAISGVDVSFESAVDGKRGEESKDPLVAALSEDWWRFCPEELQGEIIRWAVGLGVCPVHTKSWDTDQESGRLLPKWDQWHARALFWDSELDTWKIRTRDRADGIAFVPGEGEFLLFTPYGGKRPWAKAPWYGLGLLWFAAQCSKIHWAHWNDTHADPIRSASNEKAETHGLLSDEAQQQLVNKIKSLVRGGALVLPDGYKLELLESNSKNWESFVRLCHEVWPMAVAIAITGNNLTTQIEGGSHAAANVADMVSDRQRRTIARCLETTFRSQGLIWWAEFNFASPKAPWPKYAIEPKRDLVAATNRFQAGSQALKNIGETDYEIEEGEEVALSELLGVKVRRRLPAEPQGVDGKQATAKPGVRSPVASLASMMRAAAADKRQDIADEDGNSYADALVEAASYAASEVMAVDVAELLELVDELQDDADDPVSVLRGLETRVLKRYSTRLSPAALTEVTDKVLTLAALAGRLSVVEGL